MYLTACLNQQFFVQTYSDITESYTIFLNAALPYFVCCIPTRLLGPVTCCITLQQVCMQAVMKLAINSNQPTTNFYYTLLVHGALANVQIDSMLRMFNVNSRYANKLRECQNKLYVMNSTS